MSLIESYFNYTQKYKAIYGEKTLVLMQVGAFFEVYGKINKHNNISNKNGMTNKVSGSNILEFCSICDLNMSEKVKGSIVMAGFRDYVLDKYLTKLQNHGYTIVVYIQEDDNNSKNKTEKKEKNRILQGIYSSGTQFDVEQTKLTNNIMCIRILYIPSTKFKPKDRIIFGMSCVDVLTGQSNFTEHIEPFFHNPTTYDELEKYYSMYNPNELLILYNSTYLDETKIYDILQFIGNNSKITRLIDLDYEKVVYIDNDDIDIDNVNDNVNNSKNNKNKNNKNNKSKNMNLSKNIKSTKKIVKKVNIEKKSKILNNSEDKSIFSTTDNDYNLLNKHNKNLSLEYKANNCGKEVYKIALLKQFFEINDISSWIESNMLHYYECASHSFCFLLDFIYTHNPNLVRKIQEPNIYKTDDRMLLANHSLKQLNFLSTEASKDFGYGGQTQKLGCVIDFLNNCVTSMGKRKMNIRLMTPTTNIDKLNTSYSNIDYIYKNYDDFIKVRELLKDMKDMEKLYRKIIMNKLTPTELFIIYNNLLLVFDIYDFLNNTKIKKNNHIKFFEKNNVNYISKKLLFENIFEKTSQFYNYLNVLINIDEICKNDANQFSIHFLKRGIYPELDTCYKEYLETNDILISICSYLTNIIKLKEKRSKDNLYVKIHETEKSGILLKITETRYKKLLDELKGKTKVKISYLSSYDNTKNEIEMKVSDITKSMSGKDICIRNQFIDTLCLNVNRRKDEFIKKIKNIFQSICQEIKEMKDIFNYITDFISFLDVNICCAYNAYKYNYCKPNILIDKCYNNNIDFDNSIEYDYVNDSENNSINDSESSEIEYEYITDIDSDDNTNIDNINYKNKSFFKAKDLRHILIEQFQKEDAYIANDVSLGLDREKQNGILLYGTNAVGKSSLIKSIGISIILAQCGMFVPCSKFTYYPFKSIFTRILGNDNIFKGLSTFAVEMSELRTILKLSDENSLILGDELCSGTEMGSAISIFSAGLIQLHNRNSKFIFATHFHEINELKSITDLENLKMKHMSVKYDTENDKLIYDRKLRDGAGNNMYGLEVCKSLHLPNDFLHIANKIREKMIENERSICSFHTSKYNSKKILGNCEMCGKRGTEIHHIEEQYRADNRGYLEGKYKHKNHLSNLMSICEKCHLEKHNLN